MRHFKPERRNFVPKGAVKVTPKDLDAEIYIYERAGKVYALGFAGRRNRPDFHHSYQSPARREAHVRSYLEDLRKRRQFKAEQKARRQTPDGALKVGDILHYSWGYEQTQCEFYEVVEAKRKTVVIREIASRTVEGSEGFMSDSRVPEPGQFLTKSEPLTKLVQAYDGRPFVRMDHGSASLWDGQPKYCSWYH